MRTYLKRLAVILFFFLLVPLFGQDSESTASDEPGLFERTLVRDIETAGYYELVAWCRSLELNETGDADSLRQSLFQYYSLTPTAVKKSNSRVSVITVRSAYNTDYFTVEEKDQQMIVLKGNVVVEMDEGSSSRRHIIEAEEVIFNQEEQLITARGNLKYTLVGADSEDVFYGDSLDFSVSSWNGLIYKGTSLRTEEVDGNNQTFYFSGDLLKKSGSGGIFILEKGNIKTQGVDDPDFHLTATRLWLMGPGEWGVLNGVLYIGHVPLLYIPFYFKPGNELIFNPVIGAKTDKGMFIQTTTYLMGQKDSSSSSLFDLGGTTGSYELVREGLYLFKQEDSGTDGKSSDTLKIMTDWYSKMGAYAGISGSYSDRGSLSSLNFTSGLGVSRDVENGNVYFPDENGEYVSNWHTSYLGDTELPFRWGSNLDFKWGYFTGDFSFYSDPFFNRDFLDREESFDWLSSLLTSADSTDRIPDTVTTMDWNLAYVRTFQPEFLKPYVNSIALNPVQLGLSWSRSTDGTFFYPDKINLPYISMTVTGQPLSYSTLSGWNWGPSANDEDEDVRDTLLPPWEAPEDEQDEDSSEPGSFVFDEENALKPAENWTALFRGSDPVYYTGSLSYNLKSSFNIEGYTDSGDWSTPSEIDYTMDETYLVSSNRLNTTIDNKFFDSRLTVTNNNTYTNNYRNHLAILGIDESEITGDQKVSDFQATSVDWNNTFRTTVYPFKNTPDFSSSNISYTLDNKLYQKSYSYYEDDFSPVYDEVWAAWDSDTINIHRASMLVKYDPDYYFVSSEATLNLPPLDPRESYTNSIGFDVFNWETSLTQTSVHEEEEWTFQPFILKSSYKPFDRFSLEQTLEFDIEEPGLTKSVSTVKAYGAYVTYTHEMTDTYSWNSDENYWDIGDEEFVPSSLSMGYDFNLTKQSFWEERMNISSTLNLDWTANLQQVSDNSLGLSWQFTYFIDQFLDLKFNMTSRNDNMYLYFDYFRDKLGITEKYSFWQDLFNSINVFSPGQQARLDSKFNLEKIDLELVHHLREWDLSFVYSGYPNLEDKSYKWYSEFSIALVWNPIPQMKSLVQRKGDDWTVDNR